jgi:ubiquinone/menaquinone biosynthesis C-methylase UbiE
MYGLRQRAQGLLRQVSPAYRTKRKHEAELAYWQSGLQNLEDWFVRGANLRIGLPPPTSEQTVKASESWIVNAVMTIHALRPHYTERLRIERDHFRGQRVLEVGCGPLAPILQFSGCARHCADPLVEMYMAAGWPLYDYDAKFINTGGESLPYREGYFDAVISVNALDHVDDFEQTAREMERVVKPGGRIYFEVEYHDPTVTEPVKLDHARVVRAFSRCELTAVISRSGKELYEALVKRFDLLPFDSQHFDAQFCTWRALRK